MNPLKTSRVGDIKPQKIVDSTARAITFDYVQGVEFLSLNNSWTLRIVNPNVNNLHARTQCIHNSQMSTCFIETQKLSKKEIQCLEAVVTCI